MHTKLANQIETRKKSNVIMILLEHGRKSYFKKASFWIENSHGYRGPGNSKIALFTADNILHLNSNDIERECEAVLGKNYEIARNCLVSNT